jgi:hypothetical protein
LIQEVVLRTLFLFLVGLSVIILSLIKPFPVIAQSSNDSIVKENSRQIYLKSDFTDVDAVTRDKLSKMSKEQTEALEKRLGEALKLYKDRKFGQALPIFREISREVETLSIMWWLGTSAMKSGDNQLAIEKFQKMLSLNPKLQRVRLELALAYFESGKYAEAKKEFLTVKSENPPDSVRSNIDQFLTAIEENTKKVFWNVRLSEGIMWDDNVNGGPTNRDLAIAGGTLTLDNESVKNSDFASVTSLSGNVLYDIGKRNGLMWNTAVDLYYKSYFEDHKYNFGMFDLTSGPWWVSNQYIIKVPFGYTDRTYGSDRLSYSMHADPSFEYFFNQYFSLRASFSYNKENYYSENNFDFNNNTKVYQIAPSFYFFNRQHIITLNADYEISDADARRYSYTAPRYGISYFVRFPTQTEIFLKYQWVQKDYKGIPLLYEEERVDRRHGVTAVLSQEFMKYFVVSYAFTYTKNDSNAALYEFNQMTHTISIGCKF